jgi:hypothetical protein
MPVTDTPDGPLLPRGVIESSGHPVEPASLYLAQLRDRLGPQAVAAIGYPTESKIDTLTFYTFEAYM